MTVTTAFSENAQKLYSQIFSKDSPKLGDIKKIAKDIKKDHDLAIELWETGEHYPRLLAVLIMDKNLLTQELIDKFVTDLATHEVKQRNQITEWLMANQLMKGKKTIALLESWENNPSPTLQRLFWYYQGRLRWMGKIPQDNASDLLTSLKKNMAKAEPEVQWAMNFTACQIGLHDTDYRKECIELGEKLELYKGDPVARGCTPNFIPDFIEVESAKLNK